MRKIVCNKCAVYKNISIVLIVLCVILSLTPGAYVGKKFIADQLEKGRIIRMLNKDR